MERDVFLYVRGNSRTAYTAMVKQSFDQTLSDGSTLHWTAEETQARDESGRMMRQYIEGCDAESSAPSPLRVQTGIYDPAAKTTTSWSTGPGSMALATIFHQPRPTSSPDFKDLPRIPSSPYKPQITRESLGTRTIAGMEATGTRTTQIIPPGEEGNDVPLKAVHEIWRDRQNGTTLMAIDDDPRTGRHTWEVESLTIGPPDPALFTPPANYKVWDENPPAQTAAEPKP